MRLIASELIASELIANDRAPQEPKLIVSIITGTFCFTTHRLVEEDNLEVAQFEIFEEDMENEVVQYLAPVFSFSPDSFHI